MGFKENLLKRIKVNDLVKRAGETIGAPGSKLKVDKKAMEELLAMALFKHHKERDMDLYLRPLDNKIYQILVLDNELPLFESDLSDVLLRRNPTLKEMISVRNAIKILNDKDVVKFRRSDSLGFLQRDLLQSLDLSFSAADIESIFNEAVAALEEKRVEEVIQAIVLFAEILDYVPSPLLFRTKGRHIWGRVEADISGKTLFGPMVIYTPDTNGLVFWPEPLDSLDPGAVERLNQVDDGESALWRKDNAVFELLRDKVLDQKVMASLSQVS